MPVSRQDHQISLQQVIGFLEFMQTHGKPGPKLVALYREHAAALGKISATLATDGQLLRSPVNGGWYTEAEIKADHEATERVG